MNADITYCVRDCANLGCRRHAMYTKGATRVWVAKFDDCEDYVPLPKLDEKELIGGNDKWAIEQDRDI